jgi:WD40 repeat protein
MPPEPDGHVLLLRPDGTEVGWMKGDKPVRGVAFDARDRLLVVRYADVLLYHVPGATLPGEPVATFKVPLRTIQAACFVGEDRVAVTTAEGTVVLFDVATGKQLRLWRTTKNQLRVAAATPDGKFIFTANGYENYSADHAESKTVRVWKVDV